jgi:hypothetical protein
MMPPNCVALAAVFGPVLVLRTVFSWGSRPGYPLMAADIRDGSTASDRCRAPRLGHSEMRGDEVADILKKEHPDFPVTS